MKADYWRQGVATILTAGLLAVGAGAQDGAEGEVNIKDKAPTGAAATASVKAPERPVKPQIVDRDPFVNQLTTGIVIPTQAASRGARVTPSKAGTAAVAAAAASSSSASAAAVVEVEPEPEIPAPAVNVKGIVSSGSGRQAIISTTGKTLMVTPGQKLGDYRVSSIGEKSVTFTYGGQKSFKIPMDSEF